LPAAAGHFTGYTPVALQQEVQSLTNPVAPFGSAIVGTVEDLQAQSLIKVQHARQVVDTTMDMLSEDLLEASLWMDVRKAQTPGRAFGPAATAAWTAFRKELPLKSGFDPSVTESESRLAASYVHKTDPETFYKTTLPPRTGESPLAAACGGGTP